MIYAEIPLCIYKKLSIVLESYFEIRCHFGTMVYLATFRIFSPQMNECCASQIFDKLQQSALDTSMQNYGEFNSVFGKGLTCYSTGNVFVIPYEQHLAILSLTESPHRDYAM